MSASLPLESTPTASPVRRLAAGLVGALLALLVVTLTLGLAVAAFVGVAVAWILARRGRAPLTREAAALGAVGGGILGVALVMGGILLAMPRGTFDEARREAAASARAEAKANPNGGVPDWVASVSPTAASAAKAQEAQATAMVESRGFMISVAIVSVVSAAVFFGGIAGVGSWGAVLLLAYAARGVTLPRRPRAPVPPPPPLFPSRTA